jgi:hypothetical protein
MSGNEDEPALSQFDGRQFLYLNLSCIFAFLALFALLAIPIWGFLFTLLFLVAVIVLLRTYFTHEVSSAD